MWFLIKGSFWFSLVLVLLPIFDRDASTKLDGGPQVEFSDAFSAATGAYEYVSAICTEKPDVCEKGSETFTALGHRAREGARIAYEFLDERFGGADGAKADTVAALTDETETVPNSAKHLPFIDDDVVTGTIVPLPKRKPIQ